MNHRLTIFLLIIFLMGGLFPLGLIAGNTVLDNTSEIKNILISPLPARPGEGLDISLEFSERITKVTAIFGARKEDRCPLTSDQTGQIWTGRYQLLSSINPGQKKVKIFWVPDQKPKAALHSRIYSFEVAPGTETGSRPEEQTREEKIGGFFIIKENGQTTPETLARLIAYYEQNLQYSPDSPQILRKLASLYLKNREPLRAIGALEKVMEIKPAPYDFLELNRLYARVKDLKKGERFYKNLAVSLPDVGFSGLGLLQLNFKNFWPARDSFKKVLKNNPSDLLALLGSAQACWEMGWWKDAENFLSTAKKQYPDSPGLAFFEGLFWLARNDSRQAEEYFMRSASQGFPTGVLLYSALGESCEKQNQPKKAADFYQKVLTFEPDNVRALTRSSPK